MADRMTHWTRRVEIGPHVLIQADCLDVLPTLCKVDAVWLLRLHYRWEAIPFARSRGASKTAFIAAATSALIRFIDEEWSGM
jgi:hypothetical protein